jgi:hypothetical protein
MAAEVFVVMCGVREVVSSTGELLPKFFFGSHIVFPCFLTNFPPSPRPVCWWAFEYEGWRTCVGVQRVYVREGVREGHQ